MHVTPMLLYTTEYFIAFLKRFSLICNVPLITMLVLIKNNFSMNQQRDASTPSI